MQSHSHFLRRHNLCHYQRRFNASHKHFALTSHSQAHLLRSSNIAVLFSASVLRCGGQHNAVHTRAFGEDSFDMPGLYDLGSDESSLGYELSFSDDDDDDSDGEIVLTPVTDVDLPAVSLSNNDALTVTAHRLANLGRGNRNHRIKAGFFITVGLIIFLTMLLLYVDWCAWRIVRLPLAPFYLTRPFLISTILVSFAGYVCIPLFRSLKILQVSRKEGSVRDCVKRRTPTMGALFFVPIGIAVAQFFTGFSSIELSGAAGATLAFAAIGLLGDILSLTKYHENGLSGLAKAMFEMLVPLPLGLVYLGRYYRLLTSFSFISLGNGVKLADGLDGLAGGTAALAFTGMSIAVLPICSELSVFGASMAGSCVGFLLHNRYKASILMGDAGSLALGGGLAAMAACTGMFFPLFISSGVFVVETSSVIIQVLYSKVTRRLQGVERRFSKMAPIHNHLQLCGFRVPTIVTGAYVLSSVLALLAGYIGLVSV